MAFEIKVNKDKCLMVVRGFGMGSLEEGQTLIDHLLTHPDIKLGMGVLFDVRDLEYVPTRSESLRLAQAQVEASAILGSRLAILTRPGLQFWLARFVETQANQRGANMSVFEEHDEAIAWLTAKPER